MIKSTVFFTIFLFILMFAKAQDEFTVILDHLTNGELRLAKEKIDALAIKQPANAKVWTHRGVVYQSIYESEKNEHKSLTNDPLNESYVSFKKSMSLDSINEFLQINLKSLTIISNMFVKKGIDEFNEGKYDQAFKSFENNIEINELPAIMFLDTIVYYNAAISAEKTGNFNKAEYYLKKLIVFKFNMVQVYLDLAGVYKKQNLYDKYVTLLNEGIIACTNENIALITELINYYLSIGNAEKTLEYVEKGMAAEPENPDFYFIRGSLADQNGERNKAVQDYLITIGKKPDHIDALYNMGAICFNDGLNLEKNAMSKSDKNEALKKYNEAINYFEKVHQLDQSDAQTIKLLIQLYNSTGQTDKKISMEQKYIELKGKSE